MPSLALLLVSILWATTFVAVKAGLSDASALLFVGVRFAIAAAASIVLLRSAARSRAAWMAGIPLGVALTVSYASQTLGLVTTTPARSAFITGLNVALVPVWTMILLRRRSRVTTWLGLGIAIPGLWLLTSPEGATWAVGDSWTVVCAIFFALHVVMIHQVGDRFDSAALLTSQLAVTSVLCLAVAPFAEELHWEWSLNLVISLLVTAVLATVGTTWLQLRFQPRVDPSRAALIYVTEPLFAAFFSWMIMGELLPTTSWIGGGLILIGMLLSELRSKDERPLAGP